jgi:MFS family permease
MDTAGAAVGPLLAAAILAFSHDNARAVFALTAVPCVASIIGAILLVRERPAAPKQQALPQIGFRGLGRPFALFTAISVLFAIGNSSDAFLILRAQNVGMAAAVIPLAYFGFNALYALLSTPAGMVSDRIGRRPLLVLSYAMFAVVYAGFALAGDALAVGALFLLYSVYYAASEGVAKALITDLVPAEGRATALGTYAAATAVALLPASVLAGALWQSVGPWAPFATGAGLAAVAAIAIAVVPLHSAPVQA